VCLKKKKTSLSLSLFFLKNHFKNHSGATSTAASRFSGFALDLGPTGRMSIRAGWADVVLRGVRTGTLDVAVTAGAVDAVSSVVEIAASLASAKAGVEFTSPASFVAEYAQPRNMICLSAPVAPQQTQCLANASGCEGLNASAVACDASESFCARGTVPLYADAADAARGETALPVVELASSVGTVNAAVMPPGLASGGALSHYEGETGGSAGIGFSPQHKALLLEKFHEDKLVDQDMYLIEILSPGAPPVLFLWAKQRIYLRIPQPIIATLSAYILSPVTETISLNLAPGFCPSSELSETAKILAILALLEETVKPLEPPVSALFAFQNDCLGPREAVMDQETGEVSFVRLAMWDDGLTITVVALSITLGSLVGIGAAIALHFLITNALVKKRALMVKRLRRLKKSGYYDLGQGFVVYYAPKDTSTWKQGFYFSNPFHKMYAMKSVADGGDLTDVMRALNGQTFLKATVDLEEEQLVRRGRQLKLDLEREASKRLVNWYRSTKLAIRLRNTGRMMIAEREAAWIKQEKQRRAKLMAYGNEEERSTDLLAEFEAELRARTEADRAARIQAMRVRALEARARRPKPVKLTAAQKREMAEEETIMRFYCGPLLLLELFLETLSATILPPQGEGPSSTSDDEIKKIKKIASLLEKKTFNTTMTALNIAMTIKGKEMKANAFAEIKTRSREFAAEINRVIEAVESKKKWLTGLPLGDNAAWKAQQITMVLAHLVTMIAPLLLPVMFATVMFFSWRSSIQFAECPMTILPYAGVWLAAVSAYAIFCAKLLFYYSGGHSKRRLLFRRFFMLIVLILAGASIALFVMVLCWVGLGRESVFFFFFFLKI
jgi:hypothetical protein